MIPAWLLALSVGHAVEPFRSTWTRVSGNGYGILAYDSDRLTAAWEHVYGNYDASSSTYDLLYDSYFGYSGLNGAGNWLTDPESVGVESGSGMITSSQTVGDLEFTQFAFMPITYEGWAVVQVTRVRNASSSVRTPTFRLDSLHNYKPGGSETVATYDAERITERGSYTALYYRAPGAIEATCEGAYDSVLAGQHIAGDCAGYMSDAVPAFEWSIPSLAPGEESWAGVLTTQVASPDWLLLDSPPRDWLLAEYAAWADFQDRATLPAGLDSDETEVYRQQLAFFHMAQCREEGPAFGQIPASFPVASTTAGFDHIWPITWVRDSAYSIVALTRAGLTGEAINALAFLFQEGKAGQYGPYVGNQAYGISVCRVYGDGTEWSDDDGTGPNIELDGWGSFLWAFGEVLAQKPNSPELAALSPRALDEVADPLVNMVVSTNGLIAVDSSIWERHWSGGQQQYAYTSIMAVAGLRAAAEIADSLGDSRAETYRTTAESIATAIGDNLVDVDGVLAGSLAELQRGYGYLDVATVEAYNMNVLDPRGSTFGPTLASWDESLRVGAGPGYMRNDDGSAYDMQEWAFADLRIAPPLRRACATAQAEALEDWVTQSAIENDRQIPELYEADTGSYAGPVPMLGFGAGAYVLAMQDREANSAICPDTVDPVFDTPVEAVYTPACGCQTGGSAPWLGPALALFAARPRKRQVRQGGSGASGT